jgi:hypothetical protein
MLPSLERGSLPRLKELLRWRYQVSLMKTLRAPDEAVLEHLDATTRAASVVSGET